MRRSGGWMLLVLALLLPFGAQAQSGEVLNEAPLAPVPQGMTFEEYRDANRGLLPAVLVSSFAPLPGMMHFQAGEPKTGWLLAGAAVGGGLAVFLGAQTADDNGSYVDTDYSTVDLNGIRYERIPIQVEDDGTTTTTTYRLRELRKDNKPTGLGMALIFTGGAVLIGDYLYDWLHGIHTIQLKRDRVRYKYGRDLQFGLAPTVDPVSGAAGVGLAVKF